MDELIEEIIEPTPVYEIGVLTLSDGQQIDVKPITEGDTHVDYSRVSGGYKGVCTLQLSVSSEANAPSEIIVELEKELVSRTKQDISIEEIQQQIQKELESALDAHIDSVAQAKRYDNRITASLRAAAVDSPWHAEGVAFMSWMDACYAASHVILNDVQAGVKEIPTKEELISEMPVMVWP